MVPRTIKIGLNKEKNLNSSTGEKRGGLVRK